MLSVRLFIVYGQVPSPGALLPSVALLVSHAILENLSKTLSKLLYSHLPLTHPTHQEYPLLGFLPHYNSCIGEVI